MYKPYSGAYWASIAYFTFVIHARSHSQSALECMPYFLGAFQYLLHFLDDIFVLPASNIADSTAITLPFNIMHHVTGRSIHSVSISDGF